MFNIIKDIQFGKKHLIRSGEYSKKSYSAFLINRALSMNIDCIFQANEMNKCSNLPVLLQYDYLLNQIRKKRRYSKWIKPDQINNIKYIQEYYLYNFQKALSALAILSERELREIKKFLNKGGVK